MSKMSIDLVTLSGPAMGSRWTARLARPSARISAALSVRLAQSVERIEAQASLWKADSDLCRLNGWPVGAWMALPADLFDLLTLSLRIGAQTGGLFDIAMGGLTDAWGFGAARGRVRPAAMREPPRRPDATQHELELDPLNLRVRKHAPLTLTLDGIAKGYAVDAMARTAQDMGITHALFGLDGEMRALGARPDGRGWGIAVETPQAGRRAASGLLEIQDRALASSGDYRHFVMVGGQRVSHTMNPRSGLPAGGVRGEGVRGGGVRGVTVLAESCACADAWATALMIMPQSAGAALARAHGISALWQGDG